MTTVKCSECGKELSDKAHICPNCGAPINDGKPNADNNKPAGNNFRSKLPLLLTAVAGIVLAVITGITVRTIDGNTLTAGETKLASLRSDLSSVSSELSSAKSELSKIEAQIESQRKKVEPLKDIYDASLAAGTYTVGTDLAPGIYHFTYTLKNPDDFWGDYLYVTYAGSDGTEETLGGTKFDFRVEAEDDGEQVAVKLDSGSKLSVTTEYGNWNPAQTN